MIEESIKTIAHCLKAGVHPNFIRAILIGDGLTPQRAETVMLWAKQLNERESNGNST
jgi:hypothetical protein